MTGSAGRSTRLYHAMLYTAFFLGLIFMIFAARPIWNPPSEWDAVSYLRMADDFAEAKKDAPAHHLQRLLPALAARGVAGLLPDDPADSSDSLLRVKRAYRVLSWTSFFVFAHVLLGVLSRATGHFPSAVVFSWTILFWTWPGSHALSNYYQLCDLWCLLFTLLMIIALEKKAPLLFSMVGLLGVFTRQNLFILNLLGHGKLVLECRGSERGKAIAGLALNIAAQLVLATIVPMDAAAGHLLGIPPVESIASAKWIFVTCAPFLLVLLLSPRESWMFVRRFYPVAIFALVTAYQPFIVWDHPLYRTRYGNIERLIFQGLWVFNLLGAVILGNLIRKERDDTGSKPPLRGRAASIAVGVMIPLIPFMMGTAELEYHYRWTFRPFFVLDETWRHQVVLGFYFLTVLLLWGKRRRARPLS